MWVLVGMLASEFAPRTVGDPARASPVVYASVHEFIGPSQPLHDILADFKFFTGAEGPPTGPKQQGRAKYGTAYFANESQAAALNLVCIDHNTKETIIKLQQATALYNQDQIFDLPVPPKIPPCNPMAHRRLADTSAPGANQLLPPLPPPPPAPPPPPSPPPPPAPHPPPVRDGQVSASIRLMTLQNFTEGLFVLDATHVPAGCSLWPAWRFVGDIENWGDGEIDVIEGDNWIQNNQARAPAMLNMLPSFKSSHALMLAMHVWSSVGGPFCRGLVLSAGHPDHDDPRM